MGIDSTSPFSALFFLFCFSFRFRFLWGMEGGLVQYSYSESTLQETRPARIVVWLDSRLGGERPFRIPLPSQRPCPAFKFVGIESVFGVDPFLFCSSSPCLLSRMARRYSDMMLQSCERRGRGQGTGTGETRSEFLLFGSLFFFQTFEPSGPSVLAHLPPHPTDVVCVHSYRTRRYGIVQRHQVDDRRPASRHENVPGLERRVSTYPGHRHMHVCT